MARGSREPMVRRSRGVVAGFEIHSDLDLLYLRPGAADELVVQEGRDAELPPDAEPLLRWVPRSDNPFEAQLFAHAGAYVMRIAGLGDFHVDPTSRRIIVPPGADSVRMEERLLGVPLALCAASRGDLVLHAAAVEAEGSALLFCGPSRFGKTTLAAAFLGSGHRVLAEDLSCVRLTPSPHVLPGPAMLRLRPDVYRRIGPVPGTSVTALEEDRVHLKLDEDHQGSCAPVPLAGVVLLDRTSDEPTLTRVALERALPGLFTTGFALPTDTDRTRLFGSIVELAEQVPIWLLDRPLRFELLGGLVTRLIDECLR